MSKFKNSCLLLLLLAFNACSIVGGMGANKSKPAKPVYHTIKRGETLLKISNNYNSTPDRILLLNGLASARMLKAGHKIFIGYSNTVRSENVSLGVRGQGSLDSSRGLQVEFQGGKLRWPLSRTARIVSGFGPRGSSFHDGLDLAVPTGTQVLAAHSGIVAYSGSELRGYGKLIVIKGDDSLISVYAHNNKNLVKKGQRVKEAQTIAHVGQTGRAMGPHLHFEVRSQDSRGRAVAVDPAPFLKPQNGSEKKPGFRINESLKPLLAWLEK